MVKIILLLAALAFLTGALSGKCGENKEFKLCGTACPKRCDNWDRAIGCIKLCVPGCFCVDGYVLLGNRCVHISQCPIVIPISPKPLVIRCAVNETSVPVDRICNTCDSVCVEPVKPGCTCKPNYLLNRVTGRCVLPHDCTQLKCNEQEVCPANEQVVMCKSPCEPTCKRPNPSPCPFLMCRVGCTCKLPLIREDKSGRCIRRENCLESCGPNAVRSNCASCQRTCQRPIPTLCPSPCVPGCVCRYGYIMNENTKSCILPKYCPSIDIRSTLEK